MFPLFACCTLEDASASSVIEQWKKIPDSRGLNWKLTRCSIPSVRLYILHKLLALCTRCNNSLKFCNFNPNMAIKKNSIKTIKKKIKICKLNEVEMEWEKWDSETDNLLCVYLYLLRYLPAKLIKRTFQNNNELTEQTNFCKPAFRAERAEPNFHNSFSCGNLVAMYLLCYMVSCIYVMMPCSRFIFSIIIIMKRT